MQCAICITTSLPRFCFTLHKAFSKAIVHLRAQQLSPGLDVLFDSCHVQAICGLQNKLYYMYKNPVTHVTKAERTRTCRALQPYTSLETIYQRQVS